MMKTVEMKNVLVKPQNGMTPIKANNKFLFQFQLYAFNNSSFLKSSKFHWIQVDVKDVKYKQTTRQG